MNRRRAELRLSGSAMLGALALACVHARPAPVQVPRTTQAMVIAALLDSIYPRLPDTLLVGDSTVRFHLPSGATTFGRRTDFDSLPHELPVALEAMSRARQPVAEEWFPRAVHLMTRAEWREISAAGDVWKEFYRRYPKQMQSITLSPIAFTPDSLDALVYYQYGCGWECGGSDLVWLTRRDGAWRVRKVLQLSVS